MVEWPCCHDPLRIRLCFDDLFLCGATPSLVKARPISLHKSSPRRFTSRACLPSCAALPSWGSAARQGMVDACDAEAARGRFFASFYHVPQFSLPLAGPCPFTLLFFPLAMCDVHLPCSPPLTLTALRLLCPSLCVVLLPFPWRFSFLFSSLPLISGTLSP